MANNSYNSYPQKELEATGYNLPAANEGLDINLAQYLVKLKRRWKPAFLVFLATLGAAVGLSLFLSEKFEATGKLLFKQDTAATLTGVGEETSQISNLLDNETPLKNELEKITASPVLTQTIQELNLTDEDGELLTAKDFRKKLKVEIVGGSDIIEVSYTDEDGEVAENIVNALMETYLQQQIQNKQADPASAKEFLNRQLPEIEVKVQEAEKELEEFRTANSIVDLAEEKKIIVQELGTINRDIANVGAVYQGKRAQTTAIQNQLGLNLNQAIAANNLGNTPIVRSTLSELANTESSLAQERQRFNDNHPTIISLNEKKGNLRQQLEGEISRTVGSGVRVSDGVLNPGDGNKQTILENFINLKVEELSLQQQLTSIAKSQESYLARAKELPRLEKREQDLLRKLETFNTTYKNLLDSLEDVKLGVEQTTGNIEIIEPALAPVNGSTGRLPLVALGFISGLFLANLTVLALEWRDRTIKSIAEVKQKLPYQVLGVLPEADEMRGGVILEQEPDSYVSELYRMLQANLKFMGNQQRSPKVIMVTSSVPGEGKSTVTANLAAAISQLGRHVLLIDGDLRKPTQHDIWQIGEIVGLQEIINEKKALSNVVYRPLKKLDLLLSGQRLSNPLAILDSPEMSELIAQGRKTYDLVLIDAPPLPVTADVLTLSKLVDGILFVSRLGVIEHESAELAQETLSSISAKILGMVVNGVKSKEFDKYSYSSRYGKRYFGKDNAASRDSKGNLDLDFDSQKLDNNLNLNLEISSNNQTNSQQESIKQD